MGAQKSKKDKKMATIKLTRDNSQELAKAFSFDGSSLAFKKGTFLGLDFAKAPPTFASLTLKDGQEVKLFIRNGGFKAYYLGLEFDGLSVLNQDKEALIIHALQNGKFNGACVQENGDIIFHLKITISKIPSTTKSHKVQIAEDIEGTENPQSPSFSHVECVKPRVVNWGGQKSAKHASQKQNGIKDKAQKCSTAFKFSLKMAKMLLKTSKELGTLHHATTITKKLLAWIVGKHYLAKEVIHALPAHRLYCEPFCGGLSIFFAKPKSRLEVINDLNGDLINFYRCVKHHPHTLLEYIHAHPINREWFENDLKEPTSNKIEQAARWYLRIRLSYRGTTKGFCTGTSPIVNRAALDAIVRVKKLDLAPFSARFKGVLIENMDAITLIKKYDSPDALFYCDPPYVGTEDIYEKHFKVKIAGNIHARLSTALKQVKGCFVLSYNDCAAVRELYSWAFVAPVYTTHNFKRTEKVVREVLISNFKTSLF